MPKSKYIVTVERTTTHTTEIEVEAVDEDEASEKALLEVGSVLDKDWDWEDEDFDTREVDFNGPPEPEYEHEDKLERDAERGFGSHTPHAAEYEGDDLP
jgi:hypothetical protein